MNHAEQPSLARVVDDGAGKKLSSRRNGDVTRRPDQLVDIVRDALVIQQLLDSRREPQLQVIVDFILASAEAGAAQQVLDDMLAVSDALSFDRIASLLHRRAPRRHNTPPPQVSNQTSFRQGRGRRRYLPLQNSGEAE